MACCEWFTKMTMQNKAILLSRLGWMLSFALLWIGLLAKGWEHVEYNHRANGVSTKLEANYGLWYIDFKTPSAYTSSYKDWDAAQGSGVPFSRVQGTRAVVVFAFGFNVLQFLAAMRMHCTASDQVKARWRAITFSCGFLTLVWTILSLVVWKSIPQNAFEVFCSPSGCRTFPASDDGAKLSHTVFYSWGFFVIKAAAELVMVVGLGLLLWPAGGRREGNEATAPTADKRRPSNAKTGANSANDKKASAVSASQPAPSAPPQQDETDPFGNPKNAADNPATSDNYYGGGSTGNPAPSWLNV